MVSLPLVRITEEIYQPHHLLFNGKNMSFLVLFIYLKSSLFFMLKFCKHVNSYNT